MTSVSANSTSSMINLDALFSSVNQELQRIADGIKIPTFATELNNLLAQTGSVIAGGFVLGTIRGKLSSKSDIDIYSPHATFSYIYDFLAKIGQHVGLNIASPYDSSFFVKNGILARFSFSIPIKSLESIKRKEKSKEAGSLKWPSGEVSNIQDNISVDLMVLKEDRAVLDTVSNFDFTFCEVWYDGKCVNGTHLMEALLGQGFLRKDYLPVFYAGNPFTLKRYAKYLRLGYDIQIDKLENHVYSIPNIDEEVFLTYKVLQAYYIKLNKECNDKKNSIIRRQYATSAMVNILTSDIKTLIKKALVIADKEDNYDLKDCLIETADTFAYVTGTFIRNENTKRNYIKVNMMCKETLKQLKQKVY